MVKYISLLIFAVGSSAHAASFQTLYTDPTNHLAWGQALPDIYSNGCADEDGNFSVSKCTAQKVSDGHYIVVTEDSQAAQACVAIGARLPTFEETLSLIKTFNYKYDSAGLPRLTSEGQEQARNALSIAWGTTWSFWTSSVSPYDAEIAWYFDSAYGGPGGNGRFAPRGIRCVRGQ